jgi:hypothetical protein
MEQGSFVRHRKKPEWGIGRVLLVASHYAVEFENRGLVKLAAAFAGSHLEVVDEADVPAQHPLRGGKRPGRATQSTGTLCQHCERPLNRSFYNQSRTLKSCPRCSEADGHLHVFYEHPEDFGLSDARANSESPEGVQSYCKACRQGLKAADGKRCPDVVQS